MMKTTTVAGIPAIWMKKPSRKGFGFTTRHLSYAQIGSNKRRSSCLTEPFQDKYCARSPDALYVVLRKPRGIHHVIVWQLLEHRELFFAERFNLSRRYTSI